MPGGVAVAVDQIAGRKLTVLVHVDDDVIAAREVRAGRAAQRTVVDDKAVGLHASTRNRHGLRAARGQVHQRRVGIPTGRRLRIDNVEVDRLADERRMVERVDRDFDRRAQVDRAHKLKVRAHVQAVARKLRCDHVARRARQGEVSTVGEVPAVRICRIGDRTGRKELLADQAGRVRQRGRHAGDAAGVRQPHELKAQGRGQPERQALTQEGARACAHVDP